jgi:hypothetical protein
MPKNATILKHNIVQQAYVFSLCENTDPDSDPELDPESQMKTSLTIYSRKYSTYRHKDDIHHF